MEIAVKSSSTGKEKEINSFGYDALISFMEHSNDIWYIKDHESRFIYINQPGLFYISLSKDFNPEGKLDSELPTYFSEYCDIIQSNDKKVVDSQKTLPLLFSPVYGGKQKLVQPFILEMNPLINDGKSIGVVGQAKKLDIYSMHHLATNRCADALIFGNPTDLFTDREFDVIFYALQSLSVKEIARRLAISPNTVKKYINSVYEKTGVSALSQFIEYCRSRGYDKYAPTRFASSQPYISLSN